MIQVLATADDTHLGGEDRVIDYLIQQYEKKTSTEVSKNFRALKKLKPEVERM